MNQLLLTLRFYATGSMQITAGDFSGVHQTTAAKTIKRVTKAIAADRFNHLHLSPIEQQQNQTDFYSIARFPCVYSALDCTHIRLQSPGGQNSEHNRNRNGYFSLNVLPKIFGCCMLGGLVLVMTVLFLITVVCVLFSNQDKWDKIFFLVMLDLN